MKNKLLRGFLIFSALGWAVCALVVFLPSEKAFRLLGRIGGINTSGLLTTPIYDYWLRMAASTFSAMGILFLLPVIRPLKFSAVIPFAGWFMLIEGIILLFSGLRLHLYPTPFLGDVLFCLIGGCGILLCMERKKDKLNESL